MSERTRRRAARTLIAAGALCLLLALPLAYLDRNLFSAEGFADNAARAVQDDAVRTALAERATREIVLADPRAVSASPVLTTGLESFLASDAARSIIRAAAVQTHNALVSTDRGSIVVDLANLSIIAAELLRTSNPRLSGAIRAKEALIVPIADRSAATELARTAERVRGAAIVLPLLALALFTAGQWLTPGRRRAAGEIGAAVFLVGIAGLVLSIVLRGLVLAEYDGDARDVAAGVLHAYTGAFTWWCLAVALTGAIVAASAASLIGGLDPADLPRLAWRRVRRPRRTLLGQLAGAVALIAFGVLVIADPAGAIRVAATIIGAYLVFAGVVSLLRLIVGPPPPQEHLPDRRELRRAAAPWALGALAVLGVTVGGFALVLEGRTGDEPRPVVARGCNGAVELCARTFDRVTFPTAHNAMGTAQDGFVNANHGLTTIRQLDQGIRGLQLDAYLGRRNRDGVVRTDLAPKAVEIVEDKLGSDGLAAVQRLAGSVAFGPIEGDTQLYFCHIVCELGAVEAVPFLRRIRDWMDRNPNEVLSMMIEDAAPTADIMRAFEDAGLVEYASDFQWAPGRRFPTLGEMIRSGKRLWVAAEEFGKAGTWYHRGYDVTQETPFSFPTVAALEAIPQSCRPNRGPADAPLLLVNHWVETYPPNPRNADVVNRRDVIVDRARRCGEIRGRWPQLVAVDFVERGDIVGAAAELNGVLPRPR